MIMEDIFLKNTKTKITVTTEKTVSAKDIYSKGINIPDGYELDGPDCFRVLTKDDIGKYFLATRYNYSISSDAFLVDEYWVKAIQDEPRIILRKKKQIVSGTLECKLRVEDYYHGDVEIPSGWRMVAFRIPDVGETCLSYYEKNKTFTYVFSLAKGPPYIVLEKE